VIRACLILAVVLATGCPGDDGDPIECNTDACEETTGEIGEVGSATFYPETTSDSTVSTSGSESGSTGGSTGG
jgi:hypothetical protein